MSGDPALKPENAYECLAGDNDAHDKLERTNRRLTRNEQLVMDVLNAQDGPMKAYQLLTSLKDHGINAPMTVYRALDRLVEKGFVHKLDAMNAFIVCNHDMPHIVQTFLVCATCNRVQEIEERGISALDWSEMQAVASQGAFAAQSARVEIRGICTDCD